MSAYPRSPRFFWIVGVVLLIATVGLGFMFNTGAAPTRSTGPNGTGDGPPIPSVILALGNVDIWGDNAANPGATDLFPVQQGRITQIRDEGFEVSDKDFQASKGRFWLLKLDSQLAEQRVKEAKAGRDAARGMRDHAKKLPQQHQLKVDQQKAAIAAIQHQKAAKEEDYSLKKRLYDAKQISDNELRAAEQAVQATGSLVTIEELKLRQLELMDDPQYELASAEANLAAKEAQLEQAEFALRECDLVAPAPGMVLRVFVHTGEVLGANPKMPAIKFAKKGRKIIRAEVQQEWASRVRVDDPADIEDDAVNSPKWRGTVKKLSNWFAPKRSPIIEPFMFNDVRTLECIVEITDDNAPLRIGQRVRVTIHPRS